MSTEHIYAKIGRFTDITAVQTIKARLGYDLDRIRQDQNLSDHGKRVAIARAHTAAHSKLSDARSEYEEGARREQLRIERSTYGPGSVDPSDIVAHRDAFDRAEKLTEDQAPNLYRQAQVSGDIGLAKAIAHKAVKQGWKEVVTTHTRDNPAFGERVAAIRELEPTDLGKMADGIVFNLATPKEFTNYSESHIAKFAEEADKAEAAEAAGKPTDSGPAIL